MVVHLVPNILNIGILIEDTENITDNILCGIELGLYCIELQMGSLRSVYRRRVDAADLIGAMELSTQFPTSIFSRLPHVYNFCGSGKFLAWNGNIEQDDKLKQVITEIEYELMTLAKLGGSVITGCGWYPIKELGRQSCVHTIDSINFKIGQRLLLENSLDVKSAVATRLTDLDEIYTSIDATTHPYVGICLNIIHFYASGVYDFEDVRETQRLLDEYDALFEDDPPALVVLGSTSSAFGVRSTDAVPLSEGLWSRAPDSLVLILKYCHRHTIPVIVQYREDIPFLRELIDILFSINGV